MEWGRKKGGGGDIVSFYTDVTGRQQRGGEGSHAAARRTGLERRSGGAVGRQRPEAGRHGQATHVRAAGAEQGRSGGSPVGPATVLGGVGSNGLNRFQIQTVQKHSNFD
jgi:hypothetical protein